MTDADRHPSTADPIPRCYGWDVGGAHVKLAVVDAAGQVLVVAQHPCPLWQGLAHLDATLAALGARYVTANGAHALTMTGELVDLFPDRRTGVGAILTQFVAHHPAPWVYAGPAGFLNPAAARAAFDRVSSANWHASAAWIARAVPQALLVDLGSTTTDLVAARAGVVEFEGYTDAERLQSGELDYRGLVRTPIAALATELPWAGAWRPIMKELFATIGDAAQLSGTLRIGSEFGPGADGRGWSDLDCACRLARMLGEEVAEPIAPAWRALAAHLMALLDEQLRLALVRRLSAPGWEATPLIVGAGIGQDRVARLAARHGWRYRRFGSFVRAQPDIPDPGNYAPAVAVACLLREHLQSGVDAGNEVRA